MIMNQQQENHRQGATVSVFSIIDDVLHWKLLLEIISIKEISHEKTADCEICALNSLLI